MFPLFLKLKDRLCLVVGGGPVGWRKASALLEGGARVRLVCLEQRPPAPMLPALEWHAEPYRAGHLDGCALAFAAPALRPPAPAGPSATARSTSGGCASTYPRATN